MSLTPSYFVLVGDPDSDCWSIAVNSKLRNEAVVEYNLLKSDGTPSIFIDTSDFIDSTEMAFQKANIKKEPGGYSWCLTCPCGQVKGFYTQTNALFFFDFHRRNACLYYRGLERKSNAQGE